MNKITLRTVSFCLFVVFSVVGLFWQLYLICDLYFQYKVSTRTSVSIPHIIQPLAFSLCISVQDIIDYKEVRKAIGGNWTFEDILNEKQDYHQLLHNLTVGQMFNFTPAENEIAERIYFRNESMADVELKGKSCNEVLHIEKYLYTGYICYKIELKIDKPRTLRHLVATTYSSGLIRYIRFTDKLKRSNTIKITLGPLGRIPFSGLMSSPYIHREYDPKKDTAKYSYFVTHHYTMDTKSLEYPYETDCRNYDSPNITNDVECTEACIGKKTFEKFMKLPYVSLVTKSQFSAPFKLLGRIDFQSKETEREFQEILSFCVQGPCWRFACKDSQVVAITTSFSRDFFRWKHVVPIQTSFLISSRPQLSFVEFMTYVLGTISTWTGLSIIAMNPIELLLRVWKKVLQYRSIARKRRRSTRRKFAMTTRATPVILKHFSHCRQQEP